MKADSGIRDATATKDRHAIQGASHGSSDEKEVKKEKYEVLLQIDLKDLKL
jgi:hypothetical protein